MLQYATVGGSESAAPELGQLNTARVRLGMPDGAWCPDARARAHARGCSGAMVHASARRSRSLTASLSVCQDSPREGSIEAVRGNEWALVRFRQVAAGQSPPSKYPTQRSTHFSIFIQEKKTPLREKSALVSFCCSFEAVKKIECSFHFTFTVLLRLTLVHVGFAFNTVLTLQRTIASGAYKIYLCSVFREENFP
jgi:hypothetical protein